MAEQGTLVWLTYLANNKGQNCLEGVLKLLQFQNQPTKFKKLFFVLVPGLCLEKFITCMSEKLVKRDLDEEIRHTFVAFDMQCKLYEPRCEKTGLRGIRPGPTQTRLYSYTRWLEA